MRVTHAGIYLQQLVMVYSIWKMSIQYARCLHMVYSLLLFVNIRVILSKTYVVLVCGKYNTSVHRQEYSTKCYCWYCQLKLDYICTSLQFLLSWLQVQFRESSESPYLIRRMMYVLCANESSVQGQLWLTKLNNGLGICISWTHLGIQYISLGCCHIFITSPLYRKNAESIFKEGG